MALVAVVGSANLDLVVRVPHHPAAGETVLGGDLRRTPGGKGANQACAAARAGGAETIFVGALGHDDAADVLLASLERAGVNTAHVLRVAAPTGVALITVTPAGENTIVVAPGANKALDLGPDQVDRIRSANVVLAQLEVPLHAITAAARARTRPARFVLNAAPARDIPAVLWSEIDVLVVNEHEAAQLAGSTADPDVLAATLLERVPAVVVTLGPRGSLVACRDAPIAHVPARPVEPVDTTGAGDTYCGVLAAGLARGMDLVEAAHQASDAAAEAVTRPGAQDAMTT
ncbi:ribokinase [Isoptericola variabilis]|uniref:Ribokinase n=1 Tax=Isoptericola variabilis (strain 225) TaxID=743718 RepID=F6FVZ8_ISOV2|nr:ribokinase [Isoptericola variabilis]AEG44468.1 Ribokinase [Isoptericola variabilis 225]TWH26619.1 ribokinase [Isoptericola variabilis J7]